jgi:hypothetical protein
MRLLQQDIDICDATIRHIDACSTCTEEKLCDVGTDLWGAFLTAQSRSKLLLGDTPYVNL